MILVLADVSSFGLRSDLSLGYPKTASAPYVADIRAFVLIRSAIGVAKSLDYASAHGN